MTDTPPVTPDLIRGPASIVKHLPFAKLFDTAHGQLLLFKATADDDGDDDKPALAVHFHGRVNIVLTSIFNDRAKRDAVFDSIVQSDAEEQAALMAADANRFGGQPA